MQMDLKKETEYLFNCDYYADDFDPEGNESHLKRAEALLKEHSFNDVFKDMSVQVTVRVCLFISIPIHIHILLRCGVLDLGKVNREQMLECISGITTLGVAGRDVVLVKDSHKR